MVNDVDEEEEGATPPRGDLAREAAEEEGARVWMGRLGGPRDGDDLAEGRDSRCCLSFARLTSPMNMMPTAQRGGVVEGSLQGGGMMLQSPGGAAWYVRAGRRAVLVCRRDASLPYVTI